MTISVLDGITQGLLTAGQACAVLTEYLKSRPRIGEIAVELKQLTPEQVEAVLAQQASTKRRFGVVAIELGYLAADQLERLLTIQHQRSRRIPDIIAEVVGVTVDPTLEWTPGPAHDPWAAP